MATAHTPTVPPITVPPVLEWARAERDRLVTRLEARHEPDDVLFRLLGSVEALEAVIALLELEAAA